MWHNGASILGWWTLLKQLRLVPSPLVQRILPDLLIGVNVKCGWYNTIDLLSPKSHAHRLLKLGHSAILVVHIWEVSSVFLDVHATYILRAFYRVLNDSLEILVFTFIILIFQSGVLHLNCPNTRIFFDVVIIRSSLNLLLNFLRLFIDGKALPMGDKPMN